MPMALIQERAQPELPVNFCGSLKGEILVLREYHATASRLNATTFLRLPGMIAQNFRASASVMALW